MLLHKMFNFFEPGGKNPEGKRGGGGLSKKVGGVFEGGGGWGAGRVDTPMYTMVVKNLIGFFPKIVHTKAVRVLRIIFLEMVLR